MKQEGAELISKEEVSIKGAPGLLVHFSRTKNSETKYGWMLVFASGRGVAQGTAIYPAATATEAKDVLRSALLSVEHRPPK
jgi:hypothetical protein